MKQWFRSHRRQAYHILIGAVLCGLAVFLSVSFNLYRQRKATEAMIAEREHAEGAGNDNLFEIDTVVWEGRTYRRNSYIKAVLCIGVDRKGSMEETQTAGRGGQADGVYLIAQDTARGTVKILMIPRDTMTEITLTDLSGNVLGKDTQHLTLAYAYGDGREKSCEYMVDAVSDLFDGLRIDRYMSADIDVINILNDAVGGVTVTVPIDGMEKKDPAFVKGETVTLHGGQAEAFVRYRDSAVAHSALYRMMQQQEYIKGFFQAVKKASGTDEQVVTHLFELIQDNMITDMAKDEYLKMAMDALATENLTDQEIYSVAGTGVTTDLYDEFHIDHDKTVPIILELFYRDVTNNQN